MTQLEHMVVAYILQQLVWHSFLKKSLSIQKEIELWEKWIDKYF